MKNGVWTFITAVAVTLILSGSAIFIGFQYNQTLKDIANTPVEMEARKQCANNIPDADDSLQGNSTTGLASYTNYPKFDRCMASKGF